MANTAKLGVPLITGNMTADVVRDINAVANGIDAKVGVASGLATLGSDGKVPADQLTGQNTFSNVSGKTGGTLNTVVADSPSDTLTIEGQGLIQVTADAATDTIIVNTTAEVNQNAFAKVNVNGSLVTADYKSDQLNVWPGTGISVVADSPNNAMTISLDTPTWTNLTLQNGTTVFGTRTPRYTKQGNELIIEGEIVATGAVTIATLPAGYRPPQTRSFKVSQNWSTSNDGATVYVNIDGTITIQVAASYSQTISLMGIRFYLS
jgi:hypothetical protein